MNLAGIMNNINEGGSLLGSAQQATNINNDESTLLLERTQLIAQYPNEFGFTITNSTPQNDTSTTSTTQNSQPSSTNQDNSTPLVTEQGAILIAQNTFSSNAATDPNTANLVFTAQYLSLIHI